MTLIIVLRMSGSNKMRRHSRAFRNSITIITVAIKIINVTSIVITIVIFTTIIIHYYHYHNHHHNRFCYFEGIHLGHTPALDCAGMIVPGAIVHCTLSTGDTKTRYKVQFCEEERENGTFATVACHPFLAEKVAKVLLEENHLSNELGMYDGAKVSGQQTFGKSRVDFVIQHDDNSITLVEVKNVVGADYIEGAVPIGRYCFSDVIIYMTCGGNKYV